MLAVGCLNVTPAALTSTSIRPNFSRVASLNASMDARSRTSETRQRVLSPVASISLHNAASSFSRRPDGTTIAPCSASPVAIARPSPEVLPMLTMTRSRISRGFVISIRYRSGARVVWIRPPVVGNERRPTCAGRILVVGVAAQPLVEFRVFPNLFAVELHAQSRTGRHPDGSVFVFHQPAFDDVVRKLMIMSVGSKREVRDHGSKMQHRRELNAELSGRVHGYSELKRFADSCGLYATPNAAPERGIQKDHVHRGVQGVCSKLLEVYDHGIGGERNPDHLPGAPHAIQAEDRIFKIVVLQALDALPETDRLLRGPHAVRIEAKRVLWKGGSKCTISIEFVVRVKDSA